MSDAYEKFMQKVLEIDDLGHAQGLMSWDQETYMPPRGAAMRARAQGTLAGIGHQMMTAPELVALVEELKGRELTGDAASGSATRAPSITPCSTSTSPMH